MLHFSTSLASTFIGETLCRTPIENYKTFLQLKKMAPLRKKDDNVVENESERIPTSAALCTGMTTSFCRSAGSTVVRTLIANHFAPLFPQSVVPYAKDLICITMVYPFDIMRTQEGLNAPDIAEGKQKSPSVVTLFRDSGILGVYRALPMGVTIALLNRYIVTGIAARMGAVPDSQSLTANMWFALSFAKIITTPLDILKKKMQTGETLSSAADSMLEVFKKEGFFGLFTGATMNVLEAFCIVVISELTNTFITRRFSS